jgi:uncharacterized protein
MKTLVTTMVLVVVSSLPAGAQQAQLHNERPRISVSGEAVVYVKPDKITITFGIHTLDKEIQQAKNSNNDILKKALVAIKECGVPEKEIQTDHLSIEPRYDDRYGSPQHFLGYAVQNTFSVTLSDAAKVDELVTGVLAAGVTSIQGIEFQTTELKKYREEARELALKAAREKAEKMAAVLGQSIGAPLEVSEHGASGWWSGRSWNVAANRVQDMRGNSGEVPETVVFGKISVSAGVSVIFELKQ